MATRPRARSRAVPTAATLVEADFSKGMVTDADPTALAPGQVVFSQNWMHDTIIPYKRGAFTYKGDALAANASVVFFQDYGGVGAGRIAVIGGDRNTRLLSGSTWSTLLGTLPDLGYLPVMQPASIPTGGSSNISVWGTGAGNHIPQAAGGFVLSLGGSPSTTGITATTGGRYAIYYKSRLVLASSTTYENRMWFSPAGTITEIAGAWDLNNSYIDFDHGITGLAALQNMMLVFSRTGVERLTGSTPPQANGIGGDMSYGPLLGAGGCTSARSISYWKDYAVWAGPQGVYMSNGSGANNLTIEGGIERDWQQQLEGYDETTSTIAGAVVKDFYFVSASADEATSWLCHLPSRSWWRVTPGGFVWVTANPAVPGELLAVKNTDHVFNLTPYWDASASGTDADGSAISAQLTTRILNGGQVGLKVFAGGRAMYQLFGGSAPTLDMTVTGESDGSTLSTASFSASTLRDRQPFDINGTDQGVQIAVTQDDACTTCRLSGFEIDHWPLALVAVG